MPAKLIEFTCSACSGTGHLEPKVCHCCDGVRLSVITQLRELILRDFSCSFCGGGGISRVCSSCNGKGHYRTRMWMPESLQETRELLQDVEQALAERTGAWILVDAMHAAYQCCALSEKDRLFPPPILERLSEIEAELSPRCSQCAGRGSISTTSTTCVFCNGSGFRLPPAQEA